MTTEEQGAQAQRTGNKWARRIAPVLILALGYGGLSALKHASKPPERKNRIKAAPLVEVVTARPEKRRARVVSNGVVQPRREAPLATEVPGRVKWLNPNLLVGGYIRKGAVLLIVDPAEFKLAVDKAQFQVAQAERLLAVAESSGRVAKSEWSRLRGSSGNKPTPLTLHEPQLKEARAMLAAARADLGLAQLNLQRTTLRAPFNLRVRSEQVEVGQYVRVGQQLGRFYGTDLAEVIVPLPLSEMRWLKIPDPRGQVRRSRGSSRSVAGVQPGKPAPRQSQAGSTVTVRLKAGGKSYDRQGQVIRSVGEVDPTGRMSRIVVAIEDPFNLSRVQNPKSAPDAARFAPDFEIGAFVEVILAGRTMEDVIPIPAEALRRGSTVWVVNAEDKLQVLQVEVVRVDAREALVSDGLEAGQRIVLSNVSGAVEGMQIRVRSNRTQSARKAQEQRP